MKKFLIAVAGTEGQKEYKDVQIVPGVKARDVLAQLGLHKFQLQNPQGGMFGPNDDLYEAVKEGQKVFATPSKVEAGLAA